MEYLFDRDRPFFTAWLQLHDIDTSPKQPFVEFSVSWTSGVIPLYYAALCGFQDLVEDLVAKYPQHVNTSGGEYGTPLVAALAGRHFQTARHLLHNGAHVDVRGINGVIPLHDAAWYGDFDMVQVLLDYKADVKNHTRNKYTPIHVVPEGSQYLNVFHHSPQMLADIARLLLEHGADVNAQANTGLTPLHMAAEYGQVAVVRVFLEHGANVGSEDNQGATPLHAGSDGPETIPFVTSYQKPEVVRMLLKHGANVGAKDNKGRTPLHVAAQRGHVEVARPLLEHGANVGAEDNEGKTPFQIASAKGNAGITKLLLEHDAKGVL
jgi:ankyrin